jgi:hypothetical protein
MRLPDIQNIPNSAIQPTYLSAYLDNRGGVPNTSPKFESLLQPTISPNALTPFSFSAFDADGDSLRYELLVPPTSCTQTSVGTVTPHFGLHNGSGALTPMVASASTQGYYNVTVKISDYRRVGGRWALIGHVTRDSQYMLYPSTNQPPIFTTMQVNGGTAQALGAAIAIQPGQAVSVMLQATDPDVSQTLRFASDAPSTVPGLSLARVGTTNSLQLTWQVPATLPPGRYAIPVAVFDNGCPFNASTERTLVFVVGGTAVTATRASAFATAEVYPTPFREQVQFKATPHQAVVLFDALGREVARLTSQADGLVRWLPAPTLPTGLYLARDADSGQPLARLLRAE